MRKTDAIIIGAGQAGLAMSYCLGSLGIDHVVLERGNVAERWRSERWDSLRLLTPNWMNRLPGWWYRGDDPDGFLPASELLSFLEAYAKDSGAPVITGSAVISVRRIPGGYRVVSERGTWNCQCVVIATGHCDAPFVPMMAQKAWFDPTMPVQAGSEMLRPFNAWKPPHEVPSKRMANTEPSVPMTAYNA